jgi:Uma2 family endonuclease
MPTAVSISVDEYLATTYHPDCDYVDGELVERNVGETDHSYLQGAIFAYLWARRNSWGVTPLPELRVQVKTTRFRIPDITVVTGPKPNTRILLEPPLLCIEIVSPADRMDRAQEIIDEYLAFGVPCVWVVNPRTLRGYIYTSEGMREAKDGILRVAGTPIEVPLANLE